jgi:hypothetical protein
LGADSIEKQKQVELLKEKLEKNRNEQASTTVPERNERPVSRHRMNFGT